MFERKQWVTQKELAAGMVVKRSRVWLRIHHIANAEAGSDRRKATCTLRDQRTTGGFTVWFDAGRYKVVESTLPEGFAIKLKTSESDVEQVQPGVHNVINGPVTHPVIQAGHIMGGIHIHDNDGQ